MSEPAVSHIAHGHAGNLTGIAAMIAASAFFSANDACVKLLGERLPVGELIVLRNTLATVGVLIFAAVYGGLRWPSAAPLNLIGWRTVGEVVSTTCFVAAMIALPIADATAIAQTTPLAITAAAAFFLKERVGARLWLAMAVGLFGVLLIVRPGTTAFSPYALLILLAVAMLVVRDLATRRIGTNVPTLTLTFISAFAVIFAGLILLPFETWVAPALADLALLALSATFLTLGYAFSILAMHHGEIAVVSPFRYAIIVFALLLGWAIWNQWPDALQMLGIAILTLAGLYTLHHQRTNRRPPA